MHQAISDITQMWQNIFLNCKIFFWQLFLSLDIKKIKQILIVYTKKQIHGYNFFSMLLYPGSQFKGLSNYIQKINIIRTSCWSLIHWQLTSFIQYCINQSVEG